ncbi:hypothetical protein BpHYR1_044359 [Brachionus plicatilis]|uniref:Uncharacterized protein n=1 Tax=Brachionus plicatilis TaxID=10195 RepID=A0A3M7SSU9_BRAPC|nr:hypothetical protein BpHYR1_044359 [Brachionus plicatilis]
MVWACENPIKTTKTVKETTFKYFILFNAVYTGCCFFTFLTGAPQNIFNFKKSHLTRLVLLMLTYGRQSGLGLDLRLVTFKQLWWRGAYTHTFPLLVSKKSENLYNFCLDCDKKDFVENDL